MGGMINEQMAAATGAEPPPPAVLTMNGPDGKPVQFTEDQLGQLDHAQLLMLREHNQENKALQEVLAPLEHKAFARQATAENPLLAVPIAVATPLYAGAKALGFMSDENTTRPSLNQVKQGLIGVGQGLADAWRGTPAKKT